VLCGVETLGCFVPQTAVFGACCAGVATCSVGACSG